MLVPLTALPLAVLLVHMSPPAHVDVRLPSTPRASVVADTSAAADTADVVLTEDILKRYVALKKDLMPFLQSHKATVDSGRAHGYHASVALVPADAPGAAMVGGQKTMEVSAFNYVDLTAKDSALANIFKKNKFAPKDFWPTQRTIMKAVAASAIKQLLAGNYATVFGAAAAADTTSTSSKNRTLVDAHASDLQAVGLALQLQAQTAGPGAGAGSDSMNP